jgi:hypothetical protein
MYKRGTENDDPGFVKTRTRDPRRTTGWGPMAGGFGSASTRPSAR